MKNKWMIFSLLVSLVAGCMLLTDKHFHTHDDIQVLRLSEYVRCWQDGQIPCRWSADMGKGYGYPYFIFYPPMIYAVPAIIHALSGQSLIFSLNLSAYLTFPLAAYAMYRLIVVMTKKEWLASLASVMYTLAPYHALNIFVRGVYAENLAWALFPLLLAWTYRLIREKRDHGKLVLGMAMLLLTHNISVMLMLPILGAWALLVTLVYKRHLTYLVTWGLALLMAIGISAWFFVPAVMEKRLVQTESMTVDYYSYLNHFVSVKQVFLSNYWGFGGSGYETQYDEMSFAIGYPLSIGTLLALGLLVWYRKKEKREWVLPVFLIAAGFFALSLTHAKSTVIWQLVPMLAYIQFPWRLLGIATTLLISGIYVALHRVPEKRARVIAILLVVATGLLYGGKFRPEKYDVYGDSDFISGQFKLEQQSAHVYDYLPKTAQSVPDEFHEKAVFRSKVPLVVRDYAVRSNARTMTVDNPIDQSVTFASYDYPGWKVKVDGQVTLHAADPVYGFVTADVPSGTHSIELSFHETGSRLIADGISLMTVGLFVFYMIYTKRRTSGELIQ